MASFPSIRIEGGLLGPELLDQVIAADVPGQKPADFGLEPKRNLTDEIAAVFADSRALWGVFQSRLTRLPENDLATTVTRDQWALPFLALLGYQARYNSRAFEVDGQTFAVSHRAGEAEDTPPIHIVGARQELGRVPPSGRPRLAPHSLVQEYLNRTEHVWGIVTNGLTLRLLRDSSLVRRQAYVEFDLQAILRGTTLPRFRRALPPAPSQPPATRHGGRQRMSAGKVLRANHRTGRARARTSARRRRGMPQTLGQRLSRAQGQRGTARLPRPFEVQRAAEGCAETPAQFYRQLFRTGLPFPVLARLGRPWPHQPQPRLSRPLRHRPAAPDARRAGGVDGSRRPLVEPAHAVPPVSGRQAFRRS